MIDLYNIFPKPVLVETCVLPNNTSLYEKRITELKDENKGHPRNDLTAYMSFQSHGFLHHDPVFKDLVDVIYRNSKFFLHKIGCSSIAETVKITNMWAVCYDPGQLVYPHVHPNCVLSGAYYVKGSGNITFVDNIQSMIQVETNSDLYKTHEEFKCDTNSIIIWKSDLMHGTNPATEPKVAISFNLA
jgi:uncharacterized protein (TIGR02466 family)